MTDDRHVSWPVDPDHDVVLDVRLLRALAHPMRVRIVGLLRLHGPATATTLAQRLNVNTGATSYHLRELAKAGLVVEDESRGNARDRWWRAAHQRTYLDDPRLLEDDPDAAIGYLRSVAQVNAEATFRHLDELSSLPKDWQEVGTISDYAFDLTPGQVKRLLADVEAVLAKYRTDPDAKRPRGARTVAVQLQAFPRPEL
ncbi:MAG TPA: helix-turn-helix domain-containing protein [Kribbellaceae bacterium]|jgi:DNA-binding transcriptional ArsR family regulator|nr:helix-turn-helix domain-containing protein [Kribbellaceae bacterium]